MSSTYALSVDYTASSAVLARSRTSRSHTISHTNNRSSTNNSHHGKGGFGLIIGLLILVAVIVAIVFFVKRRVSP
jgi:hypothetical protein